MSNFEFEEKDVNRVIEEWYDLRLTEVPGDLESLSKFCKKVEVAIKNANDILYGTTCVDKRMYIKLDNLSESIYITRRFYHKTRDKLIKKRRAANASLFESKAVIGGGIYTDNKEFVRKSRHFSGLHGISL